jgi:site-specific recombinase XerC
MVYQNSDGSEMTHKHGGAAGTTHNPRLSGRSHGRELKEKSMDFEPFLTHLSGAKSCSPMTIKAYRSDLQCFQDFLAGRSIKRTSKIDHKVVQEYIDHMRHMDNPRFKREGLSDASIARRLSALSSYLDYLRATSDPKLMNPIDNLCFRWKLNKDPKPVEEYTIDLLVASIDNLRDRALFSLFLATGLRISEVHQLDRDSVHMEVEITETGEEREIGWGEVVGKGDKKRRFYVDGATVLTLAKYIDSRADKVPALFISERKQRMSVRAIQYTLDAWCKKLGFSHINVHRLRHTFATTLANGNISSMVLKELMGHESFSTTLRYFKLTDTTTARGYFAAMEQLNR